jgi:hypothetical protein
MSRVLQGRLTNASDDLVHEFRNFGEDVFSALRDDYGVSIDEIDASLSKFHVRNIPTRKVRTVAAQVRKIAEPYRNLTVSVDEINEDG